MKYEIITGTQADTVAHVVTKFLELGWKLKGELIVISVSMDGIGSRYKQVLTKE